MHLRRSQGDSKSSNNVNNALNTTMNNTNLLTPSASSNTGRVSIYSMRERVIQNKMTQFMSKLAPDTETEVTSRLHQEIPAIRLDGHLTYVLYMTLQNLMHLNAMYLYLSHNVFWLGSTTYRSETIESSRILERTSFEETQMMTMNDQQYSHIGTTINSQTLNKRIYFTLIVISSFELISTFLWTLKKKLSFFISRQSKLKSRLKIFLNCSIVVIHLLFISWIFYSTIITEDLSYRFGSLIFVHFIVLILLDKPNLFRRISNETKTMKNHRRSTSSSSTSSIGRHSYRTSASIQTKKLNTFVPNSIPTSDKSWSRWSSVTEEKIPVHICSTFYEQCRQEADQLWPMVLRRILLCFYRTITSMIFYELIPIRSQKFRKHFDDQTSLILFVTNFALGTFITHSSFLFPVKFQTTLHRIATHLGQWRLQTLTRTDTVVEWSTESNSYTRGSVVKLSSNSSEYFLAVQHLHNAAHPQSKSHSLLYRFFGDATYVLTSQFLLCIPLVFLNLFWMIRGRFWYETIIGSLMIFFNCYPMYKIVRDRVLIDFVEENESFQTSNISKQKKST